MYQLTYHSVSVPSLVPGDLDDILEESRTRNALRDVTGCLIYHNKRFVQILEGGKIDVLRIYGKIIGDRRHHKVTLLWEGPVNRRYFEEWNMAFYRIDNGSNVNEDEQTFRHNMRLLSDFSDKSTSSMLSFWATVRKLLGGS